MKLIAVILGLIGLSIFVGIGVKMSNDPALHREASAPIPQAQAAPEVDKETARNIVALTGAKALRRTMRDPDSFKLTSVLVMDTGAVCYEYRAKNGFSGMNLGHAVLSVKGKFKTDEMDGFSPLWNKECAHRAGNEEEAYVSFVLGLSSE